jgi:peroxiredoxin
LSGIALLALALIVGFTRSSANGIRPPQIGAPMSNFTLSDLNSHQVQLSDYRGRPVLINTWATWCPPCRAEMPDINNYLHNHQSSGLVVLAINDGEGADPVSAFAKQLGLTFPVLLDPGSRVLNAMGIHEFPTSIFVGKDGLVKTIHVGLFTPQTLESEITPLLSK